MHAACLKRYKTAEHAGRVVLFYLLKIRPAILKNRRACWSIRILLGKRTRSAAECSNRVSPDFVRI